MYAPYTANDLVRVMEIEMEERHAAVESRRRRLLPATEPRVAVSPSIRTRFTSMLARITGAASS